MKIFAISDLHLSSKVDKPMDIFGDNWAHHLDKIKYDWSQKVAKEDLVLLGGDFSWAMNISDALFDFDSIKNLNGKKIFIRGNHDYWWQGISRLREAIPENFTLLQNDSIKIDNYVICGSRLWTCPGCPDFKEQDNKIYLREVERLRLSLKCAEKLKKENDKLICLIHYPPFNAKRENSLFTSLFEEFKVDKVVYGHLHGKECRTELHLVKNNIEYFLTSCDKTNYQLVQIY